MASTEGKKAPLNDHLQLHRMSFVNGGLAAFHQVSDNCLDPSLAHSNNVIKVYVSLMFIRIGEIDTLNEKYQAQASLESRWSVELDEVLPNLSSDDQQRLMRGKPIALLKYDESHWHPQLYIENPLGDIKEQIRYSAYFGKKLNYKHFPSDVQDLSISITSMLYDDKVLLIDDPYHSSEVNREAFVDQQEWSLYEHVDTQQRFVKGFLLRNHDDDDNDDDDDDGNTVHTNEWKRPILTVTCHAARQSNYFYWNGYFLIFLITLISFTIFAISPNLTPNRIQTSCTLLLTSIALRWTMNRSLPTVGYLTTMDKYAVTSIFLLVTLAIYHAIIGVLIFYYTSNTRITPSTWLVHIDRYVFFGAISIDIIIQVTFLTWIFRVPSK